MPPPEGGAAQQAPFQLNPKQREKQALIATSATHILDYGGSRGGKTFGWMYPMITRAIFAPGSRHLNARYRYNAVKRAIRLDTFPKIMRLAFPSVKWTAHDQDGYIKIHTGHGEPSELWFGGLDSEERIDKVLGQEYATILVDEASEVDYDPILVLRTRLAQKAIIAHGPKAGQALRLKMFYSLNPTSKRHWTHVELIDKKSPIDGSPLKNPRDFVWMSTPPSDNVRNLPEGYVESLANLPRLQRARFYEGKYLGEVEGALWKGTMFRRTTLRHLPELVRIVIGIDPSGAKSSGDVTADEIGIIVGALGVDGVCYLLEDLSLRAGPSMWAKLAVATYHRFAADKIVFEANYGGPMGKALIQSVDSAVNVQMVNASKGKHIRAEPVAGLYERGLVKHVGGPEHWENLEDQYGQFTIAGYIGAHSPDRADAAVWVISELMQKQGGPAPVTGGTLASR